MKKIFIRIIMICLISTYSNALENKLKFTIFISDNVKSLDFSKVKREYVYGERASAIFLVSGFDIDKFNKVNLSADVKVITPKNKSIGKRNFTSSNSVIKNNQKTIPLDDIFDFYFEKDDPLGTYWMEVTITDNISKKSITKKMSILLFDNEKSKEIIMKPVKSAKHLDELWGEYFRTKNPWAVKRIISSLYLRDNSKELDMATVGAAAKWSLESNGYAHPEILEICKEALKFTKGSTNELLQDIIRNIESKIEVK